MKFASMSGVEEETLGMIANQVLFERIKRRQRRGMDGGAIPMDESIDSLDDKSSRLSAISGPKPPRQGALVADEERRLAADEAGHHPRAA